ncbi:MAG: hypothetical protein ACP5OR_05290 [Candidatus Dormibacteria bacterium]
MAVEAWWLLQGPGRGAFGVRGPQRSGQSVQDNLLRLMKKIM